MSDPEIKTVATAYGETEIEVVACSSCGTDVAKEDAYRFAIDPTVPNPRFNDAEATGWICPHCRDEGPVSFPQRVVERLEVREENWDIPFGVLMWPLTALIMISNPKCEWQRGYALASAAGGLWILLAIAAWFLTGGL